MKWKQIPYIISYYSSKIHSITYPLLTGSITYSSVNNFIDENYFVGTPLAIISLILVAETKDFFLSRRKLKKESDTLTDDNLSNPENASMIIVKDIDGLGGIIRKTEEKRINEWGAYFNYKIENNIILVSDIHVDTKSRNSPIGISIFESEAIKHKGSMHYHPIIIPPFWRSRNYNINIFDRATSDIGTMNMLSFIMGGKPEIIFYNKRYTYLPANPEKTEYHKSGYNDILRYLGR